MPQLRGNEPILGLNNSILTCFTHCVVATFISLSNRMIVIVVSYWQLLMIIFCVVVYFMSIGRICFMMERPFGCLFGASVESFDPFSQKLHENYFSLVWSIPVHLCCITFNFNVFFVIFYVIFWRSPWFWFLFALYMWFIWREHGLHPQ